MIRVKICGITRPEDGVAAATCGADAIGLVFSDSPRRVTIRQAQSIVNALPPYVTAVGVFVNARLATVQRVASDVGLSEVQLHGDESSAFIERLSGLRVTKALRVRDRSFIGQIGALRDSGVSGLVLDAFSREQRGGSGKRFDWDLVVGARRAGALDDAPPLILAGGLTHQNVRQAIRRIRPWGVDVSSGVEESAGIKSPELISRFVAAVRAATR